MLELTSFLTKCERQDLRYRAGSKGFAVLSHILCAGTDTIVGNGWLDERRMPYFLFAFSLSAFPPSLS